MKQTVTQQRPGTEGAIKGFGLQKISKNQDQHNKVEATDSDCYTAAVLILATAVVSSSSLALPQSLTTPSARLVRGKNKINSV